MMKHLFKIFITVVLLISACAKVPITGRRQMHLLPESMMMNMASQAYTQFLNENRSKQVAPSTSKDAEMVQRVGKRIAQAVEEILKEQGQLKRIKGYQWEFNLIDDPTVNAWCMPGGKVVVYTGILDIAKNEEGLAVVMGHEIAHAVARHGNERMSQQLAIQMGGISLEVLLDEQPEEAQNLFLQAYGVTAGLGALAYSRKHESEADHLGLIFMAAAGYNPEAAPAFWERMSQMGGAKPPELLSTHPSDEKRVQQIKEWLPEAKIYYESSKK
ncbi:MAG: M48 family peptidase [Bacteroidetes bacterium]|nr:MAG: M48 family peptidase [Bacteroidota bacterium]